MRYSIDVSRLSRGPALLTAFFILSASALLAIYWTGLHGGFVFDDRPNIVDNPALRLFNGTFSSLIASSIGTGSGPLGRPLSMASFAINRYFSGDSVFSYKLTNLLLHLINGAMVLVLLRGGGPIPLRGGRREAAILWISVVWLLHPINLTPVLLVVQRMTSLSALFMLVSLSLHLYARQSKGVATWIALAAAWLLFWPLSVLSKETGLLFPLYALLLECFFLKPAWAVKHGRVLFLFLASSLLLAGWLASRGGYDFRDFDLGDRLLTEGRVLWFYLRLIVLPWYEAFGLYHDDLLVSRGLFFPLETVFAALGWVALLGVAVLRWQRNPLLTFCILWFFVGHLIESTVIPLEIAFEHRNYIAMLGVLVGFAVLLFEKRYRPAVQTLQYTTAVCFLAYCGFLTYLRCDQWKDDFKRTQMEVAFHPQSARANNEAASVMVQNSFERGSKNSLAYQIARFHLAKAAALDPFSKGALFGRVYLDCIAHGRRNAEVLHELKQRLATTPFAPGDYGVLAQWEEFLIGGRLCVTDTDVDETVASVISNRRADGRARGLIYSIAMDYAYKVQRSPERALVWARKAVKSDPASSSLRINLIRLLVLEGGIDEARQEFSDIARIKVAPRDMDEVDRMRHFFENR